MAWIEEIRSVEELVAVYPDLWSEAHRLLPELTPEQLARVVTLVVDTCDSCHAAGSHCRCWNDD